jgi:DHA1 family bicyclomycin/chloramphenicol resistance-like MFS transporter
MNHQTNPSGIDHVINAEGGQEPHAPLSFTAFILTLASLMAINALATDIMLPAFPDIAYSLASDTTSVQALITAYLIGFGFSQLFVGFLADRYGRKPVLLVGLVVYLVATILCVMAQDLYTMLAWRLIQGMGAGAPRVIVGAAARDCYNGRKLARVMSLVMTVFMAAPVLAPAIGQLILLVADWRAIFYFLLVYGITMALICWRSFPETLKPETRREIRLHLIADALRSFFSSRQTIGYTIAGGVFFGSLFGFIASAQQLLVGTYGLGVWFPLAFGIMALVMSMATLLNSWLVQKYGMRFLSHIAVVGFTTLSLVMFITAYNGNLSLFWFMLIHSTNMLLVGLVFANFNTLAIEPQGHIAGVASGFISAFTVIIGASIGYFIGQAFDGSAMPLALGFASCGALTLVVLLITEKGKLFYSTRA